MKKYVFSCGDCKFKDCGICEIDINIGSIECVELRKSIYNIVKEFNKKLEIKWGILENE